MLHKRATKIQRSIVAQPASQLSTGRREQEQSGIVKSELKSKKQNSYRFNETGSRDHEDI